MRPVQVALSILGGSIVGVHGFFSTPTVWRPGLVSHIRGSTRAGSIQSGLSSAGLRSRSRHSCASTVIPVAWQAVAQDNIEEGAVASARELWEEVQALVQVDRLVAALEALEDLDTRLAVEHDSEVIKEMAAQEVTVRQLRERGPKCRDLILNYGHDKDEGDGEWTLVCESGGTKTYCQPVTDVEHGGTTRIRLEATSPGMPTEEIALIREADLYQMWLPLCRESKALWKAGHTQMIFWYKLGVLRLFYWDLLMQGYGCDCMAEDGSILILADSLASTQHVPTEYLPPPPDRRGSWRMELHDFRVRWRFTSVDLNHITMTFVLDPKVPHPKYTRPVIDFAIKRCAALMLVLLQGEARKMTEQGPEHPVMRVILEDPFYREFYGPRLLWFCRHTGARYPEILNLLGVDIKQAESFDPYPTRLKLRGASTATTPAAASPEAVATAAAAAS